MESHSETEGFDLQTHNLSDLQTIIIQIFMAKEKYPYYLTKNSWIVSLTALKKEKRNSMVTFRG